MWWGKIVGALLGLATGRPLLVLLGILLGHQFDRGFARYRSSTQPEAFADVAFAVMGHLAKTDGRVSEVEIRAARSAMHTLGLSDTAIERAKAAFARGKTSGYALDDDLDRIAELCKRDPNLARLFLRLQLGCALADERITPAERAVLWRVSAALGIGRVEFAQLEAVARAQRGFQRSPRGQAEHRQLHSAYRTLGVQANATDKDIKRAYRRLMNRHHPDKLAAARPTPAEVAEAAEKTRNIRAAYEALKQRRGFK